MSLSKRVKRVNRVKDVLSSIGLSVGSPAWVKCIAGHRNLDYMQVYKKRRRRRGTDRDYRLDIVELGRIRDVLMVMSKAL